MGGRLCCEDRGVFVSLLTKKRRPEDTDVPQRFALKILRKLLQEGIVVSYKGAHGGYALSRAPGEITLRQVIEAVEGPYAISRCQLEDCRCVHPQCRFHAIYEEISQMVRQRLDAYTFEGDETAQKEES